MATGLCPSCRRVSFRDSGGVSRCWQCNAVGWNWPKMKKGSGRGKCCIYCGKMTLHIAGELESGQTIRRCGTCNYSLIEP